MGSETLHEPYEKLSDSTKDLHRAIVSLMEELEAVDWYGQRADVCTDPELRAVLVHNKDEEIEHAMMTLEWIRRQSRAFDENMRTYLFSDGPITEVEEATTGGAGARGTIEGRGERSRGEHTHGRAGGGGRIGSSLGIGSLKLE